MPTKTTAIKNFLTASTHPDLAELYNYNMECQVNVAQGTGQRVEGEFKGRAWHGYTDGLVTWKSFRIPYKANTTPEYTDGELKFPLDMHVEAIGMTGWDWQNRCSKWVAFDFDAITGHSDKHTAKLSPEEMERVKNAAMGIEWVTVRKSTAGRGLHLYVFLDDVETANHNEHAALARAILGTMSALAGFDFKSRVDVCGGNMWVWARKMRGTDGLTLLKKGSKLLDPPPNWKDHIKVISGTRRKNLPQAIETTGGVDLFEQMCNQNQHVPLDAEHNKLIDWLKSENAFWWWDQDNHMLVTHTGWLKRAHTALALRGLFETSSEQKNLNEQNCFCYPGRLGSWSVRRFGQGVQEHPSWTQDSSGWTRCFFNRDVDLATAARAKGGLEDPKGGYIFRTAEEAMGAAAELGLGFTVNPIYAQRETKFDIHSDGRLIVSIERKENDNAGEMLGWLPKKTQWVRIFNVRSLEAQETETENYDDIVRHLIAGSDDGGWMLKSDGVWRSEPLTHTTKALCANGVANKDMNVVIGNAVMRPWKIVNKPFQPEYPGDREWNMRAAQLRYQPSQDVENLNYPHWTKILQHCGAGLDTAIQKHPWCKANGIMNGAEYLKCWIASIVKEPTEPLPYLFFYSEEQNTGKSIFHEALSLLFSRGYERAEAALVNQSGFNKELEGQVVCVVEEVDLRENKQAYNRIKDWVTARDMLIHEKGKTPYHITNTTHWIQVANKHMYCPIFAGDTRITVCHVKPLPITDLIPKKILIAKLEKEAPDFLASLFAIELPASADRLNVPTIETDEKNLVQRSNRTALQTFIADKCVAAPGQWIKFSDFYDRFIAQVDPTEAARWTKNRVGRELPTDYVKGRSRKDAQFHIGNLALIGQDIVNNGKKYVLDGEYLELV